MSKQTINQSQALGTKLGYAQITTSFSSTSTSSVQVTGLTSTVTVPSGGRSVKITVYGSSLDNTVQYALQYFEIWDGTVGSGTQIGGGYITSPTANRGGPCTIVTVVTPSAGSKTYNVGFKTTTGTGTIVATSTVPACVLVELI